MTEADAGTLTRPIATPARVVGVIYLAAFAIAYKLYGAHVWMPWLTWADQGRYLASVRAFAALNFTPTAHWYPLLYPLLVAPLSPLAPWLAFGIVDLICLLIAFNGFARVARQFDIGHWLACAIFVATTLLYPKIVDQWLNPWTTTLSAALLWQAIAAILETADGRRSSVRDAAKLGVVLALIPLARPSDAVVAAVLAGFAFMSHKASQGSRAAAVFVAGSACVAGYAMLHLAIYGPTTTPYMRLSHEFGLDFSNFGWKAYVILIEPRPWFPDGHGLLRHCPWLILGAAGLVTALCRDVRRRWAVACLLTAAMAYVIVMIAYVDLLPSGLWRYNNIHYFKWLFPLFGLFAIIYVRDVPRHVASSALVLAALLAASAIWMAPVPVGAGSPARLLLFAYPERTFDSAYMAESAIRDRMGLLRNFYEYHQVPDQRGLIYAIALRRDFAGDERWWGTAPAGTGWPQSSPTPGIAGAPPLVGPWPRRPIGRFAVSLGWGMPCWLPGTACATTSAVDPAQQRQLPR